MKTLRVLQAWQRELCKEALVSPSSRRNRPVSGILGWDWFQYVIQSGVPVALQPVAMLVKRLERLPASGEFKNYAAGGGVTGREQELIIAYLLHQYEIIKPSEGFAQGRALQVELSRVCLKA